MWLRAAWPWFQVPCYVDQHVVYAVSVFAAVAVVVAYSVANAAYVVAHSVVAVAAVVVVHCGAAAEMIAEVDLRGVAGAHVAELDAM